MRLFWSRVECEAAVGSNVRSVPPPVPMKQPPIIGGSSSPRLLGSPGKCNGCSMISMIPSHT